MPRSAVRSLETILALNFWLLRLFEGGIVKL